ncbi:hypothetical protein [Nodosilinea sp. FACHB-13]|uniref:hypothetical protein n=1 Tax=Cyanophyceae TaxID=3028117 RepID=UPI001686889B|nr:hypothetical protein [Nodosilinea sp. FACHB-13]MBD2110053.1 hypothetical protein [Nodosilinea sp. FACHB-13]
MTGTPTPSLTWVSFRFAQAFGWTPQQVQALTMGQAVLYLSCLDREADVYGV